MKAITELSTHFIYDFINYFFFLPTLVVYHPVHIKLITHICAMDILTSDITKMGWVGGAGQWRITNKQKIWSPRGGESVFFLRSKV